MEEREEALRAELETCYISDTVALEQLLNIVDPGIKHNRGMTLWEIHSATSFLANKRFKEERLAPLKFLEMLSTCLEAVREAKFSLQFNKEGSNEAEMRRAACVAEGTLLNGINTFQSMLGIKLK